MLASAVLSHGVGGLQVLDRGLAQQLGWGGWAQQTRPGTVLPVVYDFVAVGCPDGNTAGCAARCVVL